MKTKILVTGATGNVGAATIAHLLAQYAGAVEVTAAVQDVTRARQALLHPELRFVRFNFEDLSTVKAALAGMDKLFLLRPPQLADVRQYLEPVVLAAKAAGVKHVVFLSLQGVEHNKLTPHYKVEQIIRREGLPYTFLRPSFFMQNLSTTHRAEIAERSEIFIPAGRGKTNFVDVRDVGEAAARVLAGENHLNRAYELTGADACDYYEVAALLGRTLGRPIRYANPSVVRFCWRKWREGVPVPFILVMTALYMVARLGKAAGYAPDLQVLLGRVPTSLAQFAEDYRDAWA
ncbi:MAG: hypothetical protein AVDCRST_MAG56-1218 [uncultured Cytophagales bacterium]|uniref:NmrA-like domain-containing protein n=1 Tax=uncultured Cytophagales bacterium TaxID=158755 RepID=A0A6J4HX33_9SPHI|nr:MAG: hypothetical protein AVDCRST_MAG56-1218 [uncultured Cytophagales bacterium]